MRVERLLRRVGHLTVTASVIVFAVWTLVYQVALAADLPAVPSLVVALLLGVPAVVLVERLADHRGARVVPLPGPVPSLVVVVATVVTTWLGLEGFRGPALAVAGLGAAVALGFVARTSWSRHPDGAARPARSTVSPSPSPSPDGGEGLPSTGPLLWGVAWVLAVVSAGLASIVAKPDGDDAYFVNFSAWVAERGRFPLRDTMISPNTFPANDAHSPPIHSVEGLVGSLARLLDIEAGTATYVLVPPLATVVGVLVLARLVEAARVPAAPVALTAVVGYLWTAGGSGYSVGSFFGVRIWQGKSMLLSIVLPLLLLFGVALVRRGTLRNHLLFGAALVASVGMSNTAVFLAPVLVAGIVVGALALRELRGALRLVLWVAYPLAAGVLTVLLAPASPTVAQLTAEGFSVGSRAAGDPLMTVPGRNGIFVVTALAVGIGLLGVRELTIRTAALGTLVTAALALLPPGRTVLEAIGLGSVIWRMWWVVPIPLLLAGLVGAVAGRVRAGPARVLVAVPVAAAVALVPLVHGQWVGSPGTGARLVKPTTWKVPRGALAEARFVERISEPGDTVLVPWDTARVLAALTVDVQPVSARRAYLKTYAGTPEARAGSREELQEFADEVTPPTDTIGDDLDALGVDTACVGARRGRAVDLLEANDFREVGRVGNLVCLRR